MAAKLLNYKKNDVDVINPDEEDIGCPGANPTKSSNTSLVEYLPLQNNYSSMGDTPRSVLSSDDLEDDQSVTDRSSASDEKSVDIPLHEAAREGDAVRLKKIIADLQRLHTNNPSKFEDERDKLTIQGYSALHLAARYNRKNCVAFLLDSGAKIDAQDGEDGNTPLLLAAK